jgi:3-isopropylmalate dehydrogenase
MNNPSVFRTLTDALPGWYTRKERSHKYLVGVLTGEGIGPEVIDATLGIVDVINRNTPYQFNLIFGGKLGIAAKKESGQTITAQVTEFCESVFADGGAILCGPGGGRFVYELRSRFNLFCKLVPLRPLLELNDTGVIKPQARANVDIVVVRENSGGLYLGKWGNKNDNNGLDTAYHYCDYNVNQVVQILSVAIKLAQMRRKRLCVVLKPGGVPSISELWQHQLQELTLGLEVDTTVLEIDNASFQMVANAQNFDVVVAPNMFGDILSDCATLLLGSRGLSYSGNFGNSGIAVYQTAHGAAYDLAETDTANPIGQIFSLSMMLRESFWLPHLSEKIEAVIEATLAAGWRTADIAAPGCKVIGTREMGKRISEALELQLTAGGMEA